MDRRRFLTQLAAAGTTFKLRPLLAQASSAPSRTKPNVVVILADDLGYGDVGCYGATHVHTPHIDALAANGVRFTNAHADAATCTPSRYAMLTGTYAWRREGIQVLPGDAKSLISPGTPTIASILRSAGYRTGLVGKWHVGLGNGSIDWNSEIRPGPCELGFDEAFFFAATADRVPTVFIHNHRVQGLDPADPITVSYNTKIGDDPTGRESPELLKQKLSEGHDGTIVDGISRIGFMSGGKAARWKDEEIAQTFTDKACDFIEQNHSRPFLLYFTPSDIHVPRAPGPAFAGKDSCGVRCDVISQLDWSVGRITATLAKLGLAKDTIILFTSDNGPVVNDGYDDGSDRALDGHRPAGELRGGKYSIYEGGTREPFIVSWPNHVAPGTSPALLSQLDILRSLATVAQASVPNASAPDSVDLSATLLGRSKTGRDTLVEESQVLAIRDARWKLIDRTQRPGTTQSGTPLLPATSGPALEARHRAERWHEPWSVEHPAAVIELYDLLTDPEESRNLALVHPEIVERLQTRLKQIRTQGHT
jgi:arylsulfatase A-like enzyme